MPEIGEIKRGREIGYKSGDKHIWIACQECGKQRWVVFREGYPQATICRSCSAKRPERLAKVSQKLKGRFTGIKASGWKGGRYIDDGYIFVRIYPDDFFYPMAHKNGYVLEHRLVVAKAIGRCLHRWEIVHHLHDKYPAGSIDDKQDNRYPENLQLVQEMQHRQITNLENRIKYLEERVTLLEAENVVLKAEQMTI
uniref:Uncharacterized protein n=1 Tax=viral metagenome TaxID=1070528 RepID=A0A6M3KX14_9ZZZZ